MLSGIFLPTSLDDPNQLDWLTKIRVSAQRLWTAFGSPDTRGSRTTAFLIYGAIVAGLLGLESVSQQGREGGSAIIRALPLTAP
jgi:hypothetical protein